MIRFERHGLAIGLAVWAFACVEDPNRHDGILAAGTETGGADGVVSAADGDAATGGPDSAAPIDADADSTAAAAADAETQDTSSDSDAQPAIDVDAVAGDAVDSETPCSPATCNDGNPCTDDACDKAKGCVAVANAATCTDGDACTAGDACKDKACAAGTTVTCYDGNPCTDDVCDKVEGCIAVANSTPCSDGDACTAGDACKNTACAAGPAKNCDDGNSCTVDACDKAKGCTNVAQAGACTIAGAASLCALGVCTLPSPCTSTDQVSGGAKADTIAVARRTAATFADGAGWTLVGTTWSKGGGKNDAWLLRLDDTGKLKWETTFGGANLEEAAGLAVLPASAAGGAGYAVSGLTDCLGCGATAQVWRTDPAGKLLKTWSGPSKSSRLAAQWIEPTLGASGLAVAGCTGGDAAFAVDWLTGDASSALWSKTFVGSSESCVRSLAYAASVDGGPEGILMAGIANGGRLARVGLDGSLHWNLELPASKGGFNGVLAMADGGAVAVGQVAGPDSSLDLWLVRVDAGGKIVANSKLGGPADDVGQAILGRDDGGFVVAGRTRLAGQDTADGWALAFDAGGTKLWSHTQGGADNDQWTAIAPGITPGQLLVAGHTQSKGAGDWDAWWLPLQSCDDGNACTLDSCAAGACSHLALPDATACGGTSACKAGICTPKPLKITWQEGENLPAGREKHAVCVANGRLYVLGGTTYLDTVLSAPLDPVSGEPKGWLTTAQLATPLELPAAWVAGGLLYVAGGIQGSSQDVSAVRSAPLGSNGALGAWSDQTAMPSKLYAIAPALAGSRVYLVGGGASSWTGIVRYNTIEAGGKVGSAWKDAKPLPQAAGGGVGSALPIAGRLWLFGPAEGGLPGKQVLAAKLQADGSLGDWLPMGTLPVGRQSRAVYLKGRVWIAGGSTATGDLESVLTAEVGDKLGPWDPDGKMPSLPGQAGFSAQTVGWKDWVYVVGGGGDKTKVWRGKVE